MSGLAPDGDLKTALRAEAERLIEDCIYSSKAHFEAARHWGRIHLWLGVPTAVLAGTAGVSAFNQETVLAGVLAVVAGAVSGLTTFLNPSDRAAKHHSAGGQFLTLRNQARFYARVELKRTEPTDREVTTLQELTGRRNDLNESSPTIPRIAFERARRGIDEGEAEHRVDRIER